MQVFKAEGHAHPPFPSAQTPMPDARVHTTGAPPSQPQIARASHALAQTPRGSEPPCFGAWSEHIAAFTLQPMRR